MTFNKQDGVLIVQDGDRIVASTASHTLEKTVNGMRLTFNAYNFDIENDDIDFWDLVKMLPQ